MAPGRDDSESTEEGRDDAKRVRFQSLSESPLKKQAGKKGKRGKLLGTSLTSAAAAAEAAAASAARQEAAQAAQDAAEAAAVVAASRWNGPVSRLPDRAADPQIAREEAEIRYLEQKLGLATAKTKNKVYREMETEEGFGDGFGDFLEVRLVSSYVLEVLQVPTLS